MAKHKKCSVLAAMEPFIWLAFNIAGHIEFAILEFRRIFKWL